MLWNDPSVVLAPLHWPRGDRTVGSQRQEYNGPLPTYSHHLCTPCRSNVWVTLAELILTMKPSGQFYFWSFRWETDPQAVTALNLGGSELDS